MKRQRSRNRNGGGNGGGGGGKPQQNANRAFDSNGPEGVKVRGAAQHVYEKYQQLARDATTAGDRVLAENYLQHAEHYFRTMRAMQPLRPVSEILGRDQFVSGFDIDFEDESGASEIQDVEGEGESQVHADGAEGADRGYANAPRRDEYRRDDQRQNDTRQNDSRQGDTRRDDPRQGEWRPRDNVARQDRSNGERSFNDRSQGDRVQNDRYADRPREDRGPRNGRDDRPRYNREDRAPRVESDPLGIVEPEATPLVSAAPEPTPVLRADDGDVSHAPAFLQARPAEPTEERRPRRRRAAAVPVDEAPSEPGED
jgi:hypothetical protein